MTLLNKHFQPLLIAAIIVVAFGKQFNTEYEQYEYDLNDKKAWDSEGNDERKEPKSFQKQDDETENAEDLKSVKSQKDEPVSGRSVDPRDEWYYKGPTATIDYANRICPEYFGLRSSDCPDCVPQSCIIESDILCPYDQYDGPCRGRKDDYYDCRNVKTKESLSKRGKPLKGSRWTKLDYLDDRWAIPYKFVLIDNYQSEEAYYWKENIRNTLQSIENKTCLKFLDYEDDYEKDQIRNISEQLTTFDKSRYIKIVETMCLCGVNRLGMKPMDAPDDEINETIIFFPTHKAKYQFNLTTVYRSKSIKHHPYYMPLKETRITCSHLKGSFYHLIMHALGIGHANNRRDSNLFVYKNKKNIVPVDDYERIPVYKFFENNNVEPPDTELYYRIQPNRSVTFMDPMAWSKYSSLAVISPILDTMNPVSWQRSFATDDILFLQFLYCRPPSPFNPCHIYEKASRSALDYTDTSRNVKQCPDIVLSKTTFRIPIKLRQHFGANVTFRCKNDGFVMFGDRVRTCQRNGQWSGEQPFCMPADLIQYYCSYAKADKKCQRIEAVKDSEKLKKRSVRDQDLRPYQYTYDVAEMKAVSNISCIGFTYLVQANIEIEVYLQQNHNWKMIWNGVSATVYTLNRVEIEANVKKGEPFAIRVIAKYENGVTRQFEIIYMHIFSDSCDIK